MTSLINVHVHTQLNEIQNKLVFHKSTLVRGLFERQRERDGGRERERERDRGEGKGENECMHYRTEIASCEDLILKDYIFSSFPETFHTSTKKIAMQKTS